MNGGISCPVVFNIRNGTYPDTESIQLGAVAGTSAVNTITFQSESGDSSLVHLVTGSNLNGSSYVTLKGIHLAGYTQVTGCDHINIHNCWVDHTHLVLKISTSQYVSVRNCNIDLNLCNRYQAIEFSATHGEIVGCDLYGGINGGGKDLLILDNKTENIIMTGDSITINRNKITLSVISACGGSYGSGINANGKYLKIMNNRIVIPATDVAKNGMSLKLVNSTVWNNDILSYGDHPVNGIVIASATNSSILYNNINIIPFYSESRALDVTTSNNLTIRNNIFSNSGGGYPVYLGTGVNVATLAMDYNNYFSTSDKIAALNDTIYSSLTSWGQRITGETHGKAVNPYFTSKTNLTPNHILLNNAALPLSGIEYDIDSVYRNPVTPDIGSREFSMCSNDAGIDRITSPTILFTPGSLTVKVILQNQGSQPLTSATIRLSFNGIVQAPFNWTGNLLAGESTEIVAGTFPFNATLYRIKAWTQLPNNTTDCNLYNDTCARQSFYPLLCGTYTIGGTNPNFLSFSDAAETLNNTIISCPVKFLVRNGTYTERFALYKITGISSQNPVSFESESGNNAAVVLTYPTSNMTLFQTIAIYNVSYVKIKGMTIKANYTSLGNYPYYPACILLADCMYDSVVNCRLLPNANTYGIHSRFGSKNFIGSNYCKGVMRFNATHHSLVKNNTLVDGGIECGWDGATNSHAQNMMQFRENEFHRASFSYTGAAPNDTIFVENNTIHDVATGIYVYTNGGTVVANILKNRIFNITGTGINVTTNIYNIKCTIVNNYVHTKIASAAGISLVKSSNSVLKFNSVNCQSSALQGKALTITSSTNIFAKNNIFSNTGNGYCCFLDVVPAGTIFDYNDYYNPSNRLGVVNGTVYQSLGSWGAAINGEANGKNLYPYFAHDTSFHIYQRNLNGAAIPLPGVTTDLEEDVRNTSAPDVGADEFKVDFGVSEVISPTLVCIHTPGEHIVIKLKQFGDIPFLNQQVAFSLNNGTPVVQTIQGWMFHDSVFTFTQPVDISFPGTYTIKSWLVSNWDDDVSNDTLTVSRYTYPAPAGDFTYMKNCVDEAVAFAATATIDPPYSIASYQWFYGDGTTGTGQSSSHHYSSPGTYSVTLFIYSSMGCYSKYTKTVTLLPEPVAHFTVSTGNCQGASILFDDSSTATAGTIVKWKWNFGDGNITTVLTPSNPDIAHSYANYGTYQVILTVYTADSCSASDTATTTVGIAPVAGFNHSSPACFGIPVNFTDNSNPNSGTAVNSWSWNFGDPASGSNNSSLLPSVSHSFSAPGTYTITLIAGNGTCYDTVNQSIAVGSVPVPAITGNATVCEGITGVLYATQSGMTNYQWSISAGGSITNGGNSTSNTATVTWNNAGPQWIRVSYANSSGCTASSPVQFDVAVNTLPAPTITGPVNVCAPEGNYVYYSEPGKTDYTWTLSSNGTVTSGAGTDQIVVLWNSVGQGTVSVNYKNPAGCFAAAQTQLMVNVTQKPAPPTITGPDVICTATPVTYTTEAGYSLYTWATNGTFISGGTSSDNWATISFPTAGTGSVDVVYNTVAGCTSGWSYHPVTINPRPVPTITGPASVCSGSSGVTYSTEPGMTGYSWATAPGGTISSGGTSTSNTATVTWNTPGSQWVHVNYTNSMGCTAPAPVVYNVTVKPVPVPSITGTSMLCAGTSGVIYTTEAGMSNYAWLISPGGMVTSGGTSASNTATVTWNTSGPQWISVNYSNSFGCNAPAAAQFNVQVSPLPMPTVSGPNTACIVSAGNIYTTQPGMSNYQWSVSPGGTVTAGLGSNAITVTWSGVGPQTVSVNYINADGCTAGSPAIFNVSVGNMPAPAITGNISLCVNSGYYGYTTEPGMSGYLWNISSGGTIISGVGTNGILVNWNSPGPQWVKVNYTNPSGCSGLVPTQLDVNVNPLPEPAGTISGTQLLCTGTQGINYQVAPITNAVVYVWNLPPGVTVVSGAGTNAITVNFGSNAQSGDITVVGNNLCGNGSISPAFPVTVKQLPASPGTISGFDHVCKPVSGLLYTVEPASGTNYYVWSVPPGVTIVSGGSTNSITTDYLPTSYSGNVSVEGVNECGNGPGSVLPVYVFPIPPTPSIVQNGDTLISSAFQGNQWYLNDTILPGATDQKYIPAVSGDYFVKVNLNNCYSDSSDHFFYLMTGMEKIMGCQFGVYPVPNGGRFTVSISSQSKILLTIYIYNELGEILFEQQGMVVFGKMDKEIDLGQVPSGVYTILFNTPEGNLVRKVIVLKE
jgi:PKD repeat protein